MARAKWIIPAIVLVSVVMLLTVVVVNAEDVVSVFIMPTLIPTAPPSTAPAAAAIPNTPSPTAPPAPTVTPTSRPTPTPTSIPTPTETLTATPTPTTTPTPTPRPTTAPFALEAPTLISATPALTGALPIPTPVPPVKVAPEAINIAVLGSDRRPDWTEWHTDAVHVVSIQPAIPAVTVLSIPRDLYVYIPGFWMSRVNFADMYGELYGYEGGGPALLQQTLLYNLGIPIDHYVRTDFDGFIGIVDTLGGVEIPVHCRLADHWPYPDESGEYPVKVLEPGVYLMDGETALWYARSRMTSSTFAREQRQQQVLQAMWRRALNLDLLPRLPELWDQFDDVVITDLELADMLSLADVALRLDAQNVRFRSIGRGQVTPWITPRGGSVFLPDWAGIEPVVSEALGPVPEGRLWRTLQTVEVWNGTPNAGWDQLAADRLLRQGFGAVIGQPDRQDYAHTQLIDLTSTTKGSAVPYLQQMFGVAAENVIVAPDTAATVQLRLIVGADYQTCRSP